MEPTDDLWCEAAVQRERGVGVSPSGTIAPVLKKVRQWLRDHQTAAWSLAATVSAFLPILIGILTADPPPPASIYGFAAIAGLLAGALAGFKAHIDEKREAAKDKENEEALESLKAALVEVNASRNRIEIERADTQYTLAFIGSALLGLVERNDAKTVTGFISLLLKSLHDTLGESRGPMRVFFLRNHQQPIGGSHTGGNLAFSLMGTPAGHRPQIGWDISTGSQDAQVALNLLAKNPPWRKGSLLVADVTDPGWSQYAELAPPDQKVRYLEHDQIRCWYRIGVIGASTQFGILGVDAWKANAISGPSDENIVESFSTLLAAALIAQAGIGKIITDGV